MNQSIEAMVASTGERVLLQLTPDISLPLSKRLAHPLSASAGKIMNDRLYTPTEVAALLGLSPRTLERWRRDGSGPRVTRLVPNTAPRYRGRDILDALELAAKPKEAAE